jgi:hypothetical protein
VPVLEVAVLVVLLPASVVLVEVSDVVGVVLELGSEVVVSEVVVPEVVVSAGVVADPEGAADGSGVPPDGKFEGAPEGKRDGIGVDERSTGGGAVEEAAKEEEEAEAESASEFEPDADMVVNEAKEVESVKDIKQPCRQGARAGANDDLLPRSRYLSASRRAKLPRPPMTSHASPGEPS